MAGYSQNRKIWYFPIFKKAQNLLADFCRILAVDVAPRIYFENFIIDYKNRLYGRTREILVQKTGFYDLRIAHDLLFERARI